MEWGKLKEKFHSFKSTVRGCWSAPRIDGCWEPDKSWSTVQEPVALPAEPVAPPVEPVAPPMEPVKTTVPIRQTSNRYLSTGFALIGYTFLLQFALHLMTFLLNGLAYRRLDTTSLGLVNVRIGLFYTSLMFVARDAFRRACLSRGGELVAQAESTKPNLISESRIFPIKTPSFAGLIDLTWSILPLGAVLGSALLVVWIWILPSPSRLASASGELNLPAEVLDQRYVHCLLVYGLSGLFELATESFWLVCQLTHRVRARILIEALANAARAIGIVSAIMFAPSDYAIYSLALPQILHGTTLFFSYLCYFFYLFRASSHSSFDFEPKVVHHFRDLFPRIRKFSVDRPALKLTQNLFGQGILKQLLTEGERYLISGFHLISFTDQGIYDLVNNLGSTAARLLFLPMEESCHFVFNQCLIRDIDPESQDLVLLRDVFRMLRTVLRTCSLVGWIGVTFAQANSCLLLYLYTGPRLAENNTAVSLLRLYAAYVLLLAWNGSTEAFLNAAMTADEVARHNKRLVVFSVVFLGANGILVPLLGVHGFVLANCINMISRIGYSCWFIRKFVDLQQTRFEHNQEPSTSDQPVAPSPLLKPSVPLLRLMLPSVKEFLVLVISVVITLISEYQFCCSFGWKLSALHTGITTCTVLFVLFVLYREETDLVDLLKSGILKRKTE